MCDLCLALKLVKTATDAVHCKRDHERHLHCVAVQNLFVKNVEETEADLEKVLVPFFRDQGIHIARNVGAIDGNSFQKTVEDDNAAALVQLVFDPKAWNEKLVDLVLPILLVRMAQAARELLTELGIGFVGKRHRAETTKATTATEWLAAHSDDPEDLEELLESFGRRGLPINLITELPEGVRQEILSQLRQTFNQPYWADISVTTAGDAERVLKQGLAEGWSIRRMADEMAASLGGDKYALTRATLIARTESSNALNAARKGTMDALKADMPPEAADVLIPTWLSALADTTRPEHADLDQVSADVDGLWNLAGFLVPYPGHFSLPPEQRINCLCTLIMEFGVQQSEARQLLDDFAARQEQT